MDYGGEILCGARLWNYVNFPLPIKLWRGTLCGVIGGMDSASAAVLLSCYDLSFQLDCVTFQSIRHSLLLHRSRVSEQDQCPSS